MTGLPKLLIVKGGATVSEGRQCVTRVSQPNNKKQRIEVNAVSAASARYEKRVAQMICRTFETLHQCTSLSYNLSSAPADFDRLCRPLLKVNRGL